MSDDIMSRRRRIDDGGPLLLWDPPDGSAILYAVITASCMNPQCDCAEMFLKIRAAREGRDGRLKFTGPVLEGQVSADGSGLSLDAKRSGVFPGRVIEWLYGELRSADCIDWLAERWRRLRGRIGDPKYPPSKLPDDGAMVAYSEVFPFDFDPVVLLDGRGYLAEDNYCVETGCACDEFVVEFFNLSRTGGEGIGHVQGSVGRLRGVEIEGEEIITEIWRTFLQNDGQALLRDRRRKVKALGQIRQAMPLSASKIGRNDPCPCGSGRKFKRCHGSR